MDPQDTARLYELFHPFAVSQAQRVAEGRMRFVHYTNAEAAMNMIASKEVWMRRVDCMNDYLEVHYGEDCVIEAFRGDGGKAFKELFKQKFPKLIDEVDRRSTDWLPSFRMKSYVACVSEHLDEEDELGRLSMWRAYGGGTGVALVLNHDPFLSPSDALGVYTVPVGYLTKDQFIGSFDRLVENLKESSDFILGQNEDALMSCIFNMLSFALVGTKHPGFREELEWRVIYFPFLDQKKRLIKSIEKINGVPQPVYKIPLKNIPEENLNGIEVSELIDRIIIGPSDFALPIRDAFLSLLENAGVENPCERIYVSDIPLR